MKRSSIQDFTTVVVASGNLFVREATRLFRPYGITVPQFDALERLSHAPGGLRQNELAASLVVDPSTATYLIDVLEKRNWILRTDDPDDRRAHRIVLTDAGKAIHTRAARPYRAALTHLHEHLNQAEVEIATRVLEALPQAATEAIAHAAAEKRSPGKHS